MKFIVVTGGVMSGIGKGITSSTIGLLLQKAGQKVDFIKIDPYINVDSGTMSPFEHGECYVLEDGTETDLDLGNYERFCNLTLSEKNSITSGKIWKSVIENERRGDYLGKTVQMVPHITDEIIRRITYDGDEDYRIIELGGTVGDMESDVFFEAFRQINMKNRIFFVHVSMVIGEEQKTKPTQQSIKALRERGIFPEVIVVRCDSELKDETRMKLAKTCGFSRIQIIQSPKVDSIYRIPLIFKREGIINLLHYKVGKLALPVNSYINLDEYERYVSMEKGKGTVYIVGKYTGIQDTYLSVVRAIEHASFANGERKSIKIVNPDDFLSISVIEDDRVVIPGGFGNRDIEKLILSIRKCREEKIRTLGICLGFQIMVIEFLRANGFNANSEEFSLTERNKKPVNDEDTEDEENENKEEIVIRRMNNISELGGTMRKGLFRITLKEGSIMERIYDSDNISVRFRHRYEIINRLLYNKITGFLKNIPVAGEYEDYMIGVQFHPEFQTSLEKPNPLFKWLTSD